MRSVLALFLLTAIACTAEEPSVGTATVSASSQAIESADADFAFGDPEFRRCPIDDVSALLTEDRKTLSVFFTGYEVNLEVGQRRGHTRCMFDIPIHIPQGFTLTVVSADYRGFASIPTGGLGLVQRKYHLAGAQRSQRTAFRGGFDDEFSLIDDVRLPALVGRACGKNAILRVQTELELIKPRRADEALIALDSLDTTGGFEFQLSWRACSR